MTNRAFVKVCTERMSDLLFENKVKVIDCVRVDPGGQSITLEIEGPQLPPLDAEGRPREVECFVAEPDPCCRYTFKAID